MNIKQPSKNWDRLKSIVEPLREWRNTSNRGYLCEIWAINALKKQSFQILFHHCKCVHVEVDVLARSPSGELWIIEVKSNSFEEFAGSRLGLKQKQRLERVMHCLIEGGFDVRVILALVEGSFEIQWIDAFNSEEIQD